MRERRERGRKLPQVKQKKKFDGGRIRGKEIEKKKKEKEKRKRIKRKIKEGKEEKNEGEWVIRERKKKGNDTSLGDLKQIGGRNALGQETKLVHAAIATRGYQKLRASLCSKR